MDGLNSNVFSKTSQPWNSGELENLSFLLDFGILQPTLKLSASSYETIKCRGPSHSTPDVRRELG
jgi:hypothetical protein